MSDLVSKIKTIQRAVGADPDGVFGPLTAGKVLEHLANMDLVDPETLPVANIDERSRENILTLDRKARDRFVEFLTLAKATAATFGCDYVAIGGGRTWAQQDVLYARGRTAPGSVVTNAKGGQSNHNFGIALDFGVFQGKIYLDGGTPPQAALANKVHAACAVHARQMGIDWGGDWQSPVDPPHFEIHTGLTLAEKRNVFRERGSVL